MRIRQKLATALENRVAIGIIASLATGIGSVLYFYVVDYDHLSFKIRIAFALSNGLLSGMGVGLSLGLAIKLDKRIEPMEVLSWSWTAIRRNIFRWLLIGIGIGLILGLIFVLTFMMSRPSLWLATFPRDGLPGALHLVLILMLVNGVRRGLSKRVLGTQPIIAPNQGTWRSARYGGGIAIICGVIIGVLNGATTFMGAFWLPSHMGIHMDRGRSFSVDIMSHVLGFYPTTGQEFWTLYALFSGLENGTIVGLAAGLYCGWAAFIQHFVLRFLLWCARCVPFNYSRFLDYAAERILLRKVGGGYIFIHRLLLDYFASLEEEQTPRKVDATEHKQDALV